MDPVMSSQADVLLVTVTKVESQAVLAAFEGATGQKARLEPREGKAYHDLGSVNGARVWMVRSEMGAGGLGSSQQTVTKAIAEVRPSSVIMVGIAFGTRPSSQAIGDVLVSQRLALYELQWVGTVGGKQKLAPFGDRPHASTRLLDFLRAADLDWTASAVHFGLILSGEKLVDNLEFRQQLCDLESDAIGGEMEAAGLYAACHEAKVDWVLVKAICDWADGDKETDRSARQQLAAKNAAEFVLHLLQSVSLKQINPTPLESTVARSGERIHQSGSGINVMGDGNAVASGGSSAVSIGGNVHGDVNIGSKSAS